MSTLRNFAQDIRQGLINLVVFLVPAWGIATAVFLVAHSPLGNQDSGSYILVVVGASLPFAFPRHIWRVKTAGNVAKALAFVAYYIASCFAMFVVGWAALASFGPGT